MQMHSLQDAANLKILGWYVRSTRSIYTNKGPVSSLADLAATTGMDALSHAIESYVSLNANPITEMYSLHAIELIVDSLATAVEHGDDVDARGKMMLAS